MTVCPVTNDQVAAAAILNFGHDASVNTLHSRGNLAEANPQDSLFNLMPSIDRETLEHQSPALKAVTEIH